MDKARRKISDRLILPILLAVVLVAPPVLYVWGYFAFSTRIVDFGYDGAVVRCYDSRWKAKIFYPAGRVEGVLIGNRVRVEFDPIVSSGS